MADANFARFNKRVREIEGRHKRLASGYVRLEERDGLLVPVERVRPRRSLPLRGITLSLVAFLLFKGFLLAYLGPITYGDRLAALETGNAAERLGGWIMAADPVTLWIASQIGLLI